MVRRRVVLVCSTLLVAGALSAQGQIKSYSSYEDYCADNPHASTCSNGKPIKFDPNNNPLLHEMQKNCRYFPNDKGCQQLCASNPSACKPTPQAGTGNGASQRQSANGQATRQNSATTPTAYRRSRNGSSIIELPGGPPTAAQLAAAKSLGPADWRFADPHPDVLLGINATALRQSSTLRSVLTQLAPALKMTPDDVESALAQSNDIDRFLISIHSTDTVIVLQGARINAPPGPTGLGNGMVAYGLARNSVLIGHPDPASAAMQRMHGAAGLSAAALQMRAQGAESDFWMVGTQSGLKDAKLQISKLSDDLSSYSLGVSLRDGVKVDLRLNYATAASARRALAAMRNSPPPPEWPIRISSEMVGTAVQMKVAVAQAEISRALDKALAAPSAKPILEMIARKMQSSGEMVVYGPEGPKTIHTTPTTAPPPGKLVIYGLPGGPKIM